MRNQSADLSWSGDVPVSDRYGDPYYSLENGVAETRHVFLAGNGLPERMRPGFHIAELGFGTGLNLLVTLEAARAAGRLPFRYTGFEAHPMAPAEMRRALSAFPALTADRDWLVGAWGGGYRFATAEVEVEVIVGPAAETLPGWNGAADAWFLDGFAPARNPDLWTAELMSWVARRTAPGGTVASYTAAGHVRRALAEAGFEVTRLPGYGRKRHMTAGRRA